MAYSHAEVGCRSRCLDLSAPVISQNLACVNHLLSVCGGDDVVLQPVESSVDLHQAVADRNLKLVKQLLAEGADPCARDKKVGCRYGHNRY